MAFFIIFFIISNAPFAIKNSSVSFSKINPAVFVKATMLRIIEIWLRDVYKNQAFPETNLL